VRLRTIGATAALLTGLATAAFAQGEASTTTPRLESMLRNAMAPTSAVAVVGETPRLEAMLGNAMAQAATATGSDEHQFGVGVRTGSAGGLGFGAGIRYFMNGPIGFQVEYSHYGFGLGFNEIQAAVLYRFKDIKLDFPLILSPYIGGGIAYTSYGSFNNTGGLGLGGIEAFFAQVPQLGVSVQFAFRPSISGVGFGGLGSTIGLYWYFN
jgi:hypothetical protein